MDQRSHPGGQRHWQSCDHRFKSPLPAQGPSNRAQQTGNRGFVVAYGYVQRRQEIRHYAGQDGWRNAST